MLEADIINKAPEDILENLFEIAGGDPSGLAVAKACVEKKIDMVSEARWFAQIGILDMAVAYVSVSELPSFRKIELTQELATEVSKSIFAKPVKSDKDELLAKRAEIIIQVTTDYLEKPPSRT